jgi:hypothetical protein
VACRCGCETLYLVESKWTFGEDDGEDGYFFFPLLLLDQNLLSRDQRKYPNLFNIVPLYDTTHNQHSTEPSGEPTMSRSALWRQEANVKDRERKAEECFRVAIEEGRVSCWIWTDGRDDIACCCCYD